MIYTVLSKALPLVETFNNKESYKGGLIVDAVPLFWSLLNTSFNQLQQPYYSLVPVSFSDKHNVLLDTK